MNICVECKHCEPHIIPRFAELYNCLNPQAKRSREKNPITGIIEQHSVGCYSLNYDGNCQLYEAKA